MEAGAVPGAVPGSVLPSGPASRPGSAVAPGVAGPAATLLAILGRMPGPSFAVLDGAGFEDLPAALGAAALAGRSLVLDAADRDTQLAGPWLVPLALPAASALALELSGSPPHCVAWCCPGGEAVLFRHLRRLNRAVLPAWAARGGGTPDPAAAGPEAVLFRHWDPGVLDALLPVLNEVQFSQVLGPATEIAFVAPGSARTRRVVADPDWPVRPAGPLVLRPDQVEALTQRRLEASRLRLAGYLRRTAPDHVAHLDDAQLHALAARHQDEAHALGIGADRETFMWSFMRVTSVGDLSRDEGITRLMADTRVGPDPEARLRQLFRWRTEHLRRME